MEFYGGVSNCGESLEKIQNFRENKYIVKEGVSMHKLF